MNQLYDSGAENVAGRCEVQRDIVAQVLLLTETDRLETFDGSLAFALGVERARGAVFRKPVPIRELRVTLLQKPAIGQQDRAQIPRGGGAVDPT